MSNKPQTKSMRNTRKRDVAWFMVPIGLLVVLKGVDLALDLAAILK